MPSKSTKRNMRAGYSIKDQRYAEIQEAKTEMEDRTGYPMSMNEFCDMLLDRALVAYDLKPKGKTDGKK